MTAIWIVVFHCCLSYMISCCAIVGSVPNPFQNSAALPDPPRVVEPQPIDGENSGSFDAGSWNKDEYKSDRDNSYNDDTEYGNPKPNPNNRRQEIDNADGGKDGKGRHGNGNGGDNWKSESARQTAPQVPPARSSELPSEEEETSARSVNTTIEVTTGSEITYTAGNTNNSSAPKSETPQTVTWITTGPAISTPQPVKTTNFFSETTPTAIPAKGCQLARHDMELQLKERPRDAKVNPFLLIRFNQKVDSNCYTKLKKELEDTLKMKKWKIGDIGYDEGSPPAIGPSLLNRMDSGILTGAKRAAPHLNREVILVKFRYPYAETIKRTWKYRKRLCMIILPDGNTVTRLTLHIDRVLKKFKCRDTPRPLTRNTTLATTMSTKKEEPPHPTEKPETMPTEGKPSTKSSTAAEPTISTTKSTSTSTATTTEEKETTTKKKTTTAAPPPTTALPELTTSSSKPTPEVKPIKKTTTAAPKRRTKATTEMPTTTLEETTEGAAAAEASKSPPAGVIVAMVLGILLVIALIAIVLFLTLRQKGDRKANSSRRSAPVRSIPSRGDKVSRWPVPPKRPISFDPPTFPLIKHFYKKTDGDDFTLATEGSRTAMDGSEADDSAARSAKSATRRPSARSTKSVKSGRPSSRRPSDENASR